MTSRDTAVRDRIIDAASESFARNGFGGTSLRQVASRADVSYASIHYHFGSKAALYEAALDLHNPESIGKHFPPVPSVDQMSRQEAIALLRDHIKILVDMNTYVASQQHLAQAFAIGEGLIDGKPDNKFYHRTICPGHEGCKRLIRVIRPDIEDESTLEIMAFNVVGQCLMIRIARGILMRRLKVRRLSTEHADALFECINEMVMHGLPDAHIGSTQSHTDMI